MSYYVDMMIDFLALILKFSGDLGSFILLYVIFTSSDTRESVHVYLKRTLDSMSKIDEGRIVKVSAGFLVNVGDKIYGKPSVRYTDFRQFFTKKAWIASFCATLIYTFFMPISIVLIYLAYDLFINEDYINSAIIFLFVIVLCVFIWLLIRWYRRISTAYSVRLKIKGWIFHIRDFQLKIMWPLYYFYAVLFLWFLTINLSKKYKLEIEFEASVAYFIAVIILLFCFIWAAVSYLRKFFKIIAMFGAIGLLLSLISGVFNTIIMISYFELLEKINARAKNILNSGSDMREGVMTGDDLEVIILFIFVAIAFLFLIPRRPALLVGGAVLQVILLTLRSFYFPQDGAPGELPVTLLVEATWAGSVVVWIAVNSGTDMLSVAFSRSFYQKIVHSRGFGVVRYLLLDVAVAYLCVSLAVILFLSWTFISSGLVGSSEVRDVAYWNVSGKMHYIDMFKVSMQWMALFNFSEIACGIHLMENMESTLRCLESGGIAHLKYLENLGFSDENISEIVLITVFGYLLICTALIPTVLNIMFVIVILIYRALSRSMIYLMVRIFGKLVYAGKTDVMIAIVLLFLYKALEAYATTP